MYVVDLDSLQDPGDVKTDNLVSGIIVDLMTLSLRGALMSMVCYKLGKVFFVQVAGGNSSLCEDWTAHIHQTANFREC